MAAYKCTEWLMKNWYVEEEGGGGGGGGSDSML